MVHADAAGLPQDVASKEQFYAHIQLQIAALLDGQQNWVTNLANASSVLYNTMNRFSAWKEKRVNWAGFYLLAPLFPGASAMPPKPTLWLGPFCGLPACQAIPSVIGRGVCADGSAKLPPATVCVPRTDDYRTYRRFLTLAGHIACDSMSQSEIVVPIIVPRARLSSSAQAALQGHGPQALIDAWAGRGDGEHVIVGVLDIDCEAANGFDQDDVLALERIVAALSTACTWS